MAAPLWTDADLARQFAKAQPWMPFFRQAAAKHGLPVELLLALASRESNIENKLGDYVNGSPHGFGVMQIDIGTDLAFCRAWTPEKVQATIERGAELLAEKRDYLIHEGLPASLLAIAASYNTGQGNVSRSLRGGFSPDRTTKYGNYGADVIARMNAFAKLLRLPPVANL